LAIVYSFKKHIIMGALKKMTIWVLSFALLLVVSSCGSAVLRENQTLGKLPALSEKYQNEIASYKEKAKQSTDMEEAFAMEKKFKLTKEEADQVINDYVAVNISEIAIPFEQPEESQFEVLDMHLKGASRTRMDLVSKVKIKEDLKNKYGGFEKYFFAYIKAVDKDGNTLGKPTVMSSGMGNRGPYIAGLEVPIEGSIGNLKYFVDFEKIVFISKEDYEKNK
jgi:hypothetical protein